MKILFHFLIITIFGLTACNPNIDFKNIVPEHIDKFATEFISQIRIGNIDSCYNLMSSEMQKEKGKESLNKSYMYIKDISLDSFRIIDAKKTSLFGKNGFTNYWIEYEYKLRDQFLYVTYGIKEQNNNLKITAFEGMESDIPLSKVHSFTLNHKGFSHYLFLFFAILIPIFILVTIVFAIRAKLNRKWLWIIGITLGLMKFSINWTTGQISFSIINFTILGAGLSKSGIVSPWILSFSLPIIAVLFWYNIYAKNKKIELNNQTNGRITESENQEIIG